MTTYYFADDYEDNLIDFDPTGDVMLFFNFTAADYRLTDQADGSGVLVSDGTYFSRTFLNTSAQDLNESNTVFDDGSKIVNAYVGNAFSSDLTGTAHGDLLVGAPALRAMAEVAVSIGGDLSGIYATDPAVSGDGRYVVFDSNATEADSLPDGVHDVWLKDLLTGQVTRISTKADGTPGNQQSADATVSGDGRTVVFESLATNFDSNDTNHGLDIYMKDVVTGALTRVSADADGQGGTDGNSFDASLSHDGRYVVFTSDASDLIDNDTNQAADVFLKDTLTGALTLVSADTDGVQGNAGQGGDLGSSEGRISADGKFVVFTSWSDNLVDNDADSRPDVFVKNLLTGEVTCVSMDADGQSVSGDAQHGAISANGRYVVFESAGQMLNDGWDGAGSIYMRDMQTGELTRVKNAYPNSHSSITVSGDGRFVVFVADEALVDNDVNGAADVYVKDMHTGELALVSQSALHEVGDDESVQPELSADGSTIVFRTHASNLAPDDSNGTASVVVVTNPLFTDTLRGGEGDDTYIVGSSSEEVVENADEGHDTVRAGGSFTLSDNVEDLVLTGTGNVTGTGNALSNTITGNSGSNLLSGGAGSDTLNGSSGGDLMSGGTGGDEYYVDSIFDTVDEASAAGYDTVRAFISYALPSNVERLDLVIGTQAFGNQLANVINGNLSDNVLDGGAGADVMSGSAGNDTYIVDNAADQTLEVEDMGTDLVQASLSWTLAAEIEKLTLTGSAAINGTGNGLANGITGNSAANVLNGAAGADTLTGGTGNDTYYVDNTGDKTIEVAGGGVDSVQSVISWTLQAEVENLTLKEAATNGTGNALANAITGTAAANVLNGGAGADTLTGGAGSDTYVVDNAGDKTVEVAAGGTDLVQSSITFTLQTEVEKLTLTGTAAINGTGNTLANTITGNSAANVLNGLAGADTLTGGAGSDTYVVDNAGDKTVEVAAGGTDLAQSSITFTLQAEVEKLTLTGTAAINGTGNSAANTIVGNSAANTIDGRAGTDTLTGGAGNDIFAFTTAAASDLITDFTSGADKLRLSQAALKVGDGDTAIEGAVSVTGPNGYSNAAELVIITHNISGSITASSAAAAIGHANSAYHVGDSRLFVVDNGVDSAVYLFKSANANATVTAAELTLVATLDNTHATVTTDYLFGA